MNSPAYYVEPTETEPLMGETGLAVWADDGKTLWYNLILNGFFLFSMFVFGLGTLVVNIYWFTVTPFDIWSLWPLLALLVMFILWIVAVIHWFLRVGPYTKNVQREMEKENPSLIWTINFDRIMKVIVFFGLLFVFALLGATAGLIVYMVAGTGECALHSICDSYLSYTYKWTIAWLVFQFGLLIVILMYSALKFTELVGASDIILRIIDVVVNALYIIYGIISLIFLMIFMYYYTSDDILWEFFGYTAIILVVGIFIGFHELFDLLEVELWVIKQIRHLRIFAFGIITFVLALSTRVWAHYQYGPIGCAGYDFCTGDPQMARALLILSASVFGVSLWAFSYRVLSEAVFQVKASASGPAFQFANALVNTAGAVGRTAYRKLNLPSSKSKTP